jgi:hypothetical protein
VLGQERLRELVLKWWVLERLRRGKDHGRMAQFVGWFERVRGCNVPQRPYPISYGHNVSDKFEIKPSLRKDQLFQTVRTPSLQQLGKREEN